MLAASIIHARHPSCPCSKSKAALKKMKFPPELDLRVDYDKVCRRQQHTTPPPFCVVHQRAPATVHAPMTQRWRFAALPPSSPPTPADRRACCPLSLPAPPQVNWVVMKEWVAKRVTELLGLEEEVLISMIHNHLIDQVRGCAPAVRARRAACVRCGVRARARAVGEHATRARADMQHSKARRPPPAADAALHCAP
jgi:hypothetical protein